MASSSSNLGSRVEWIKYANKNCLWYRWCQPIGFEDGTLQLLEAAATISVGVSSSDERKICMRDEIDSLVLTYDAMIDVLKKDVDVKISAINKLMEDEIKTMKQDSEIQIYKAQKAIEADFQNDRYIRISEALVCCVLLFSSNIMDFFSNQSNDQEMNMTMNLEKGDGNGSHFVTQRTHEVVESSSAKEITLETVMNELQTMKDMIKKMMEQQEVNRNELTGMKTTCTSIEMSLKRLEEKESGGGGGLFTQPMQAEAHPATTPRSTPMDMSGTHVDHINDDVGTFSKDNESVNADMDIGCNWSHAMNLENDSLNPVLPGIWLPESGAAAQIENAISLPRSDFRRTKAGMVSPNVGTAAQPKRLFQSSSPSPTSSGRGRRSNCKGKKKMEDSGSKRPKLSTPVIPKGLKLNFRPTAEMMLETKEVQACVFLFQKTKDPEVLEERIIKAGDLEASRQELQCLCPTKIVSDLVMTLMVENIREAQKPLSSQAVWCFPPSFEVDFNSSMGLADIKSKYCTKWMPPYPKLQFIYVPLKTTSGHWYLMIIHLKHQTIYHLDSFCPVLVSEGRKLRIRRMAKLIYDMMLLDANYSIPFRNKRIDFMNFKIVDAYGIPCTGNSENSAVWVLEWLSMEQFFVPDLMYGNLVENSVRMKTAATLMLGGHNEIRAMIEENALSFTQAVHTVQPISLD